MASNFRFFFILGLLTAVLGCHKAEESSEHEEFHGPVLEVREQSAEFKIPSKAWDLLLSDAASEKKEAAGGGGHGGGAKKGAEESELTTASFLYAPIEVVLKEKTAGTLKDPEIRFRLPDGGGEIDLSKWTTGKAGTFFVSFNWQGEEPESSSQKILFYSRARKRRVGDQTIGSGCKSLMDLTSAVMSSKKHGGLAVNTTRNFHSTVLGGHFLFSWMSDGMRKLTQVTFRDSQNPSYSCESEK